MPETEQVFLIELTDMQKLKKAESVCSLIIDSADDSWYNLQDTACILSADLWERRVGVHAGSKIIPRFFQEVGL